MRVPTGRTAQALLLILLVAALGAALQWCSWRRERRARTPTIESSGNVEAHESLLAFKLEGTVVDLPVQEGQWVDKGAVVARIDDTDYQQQARIRQAELQTAQSQLDLLLAGTRAQELQASKQSWREAQAQARLQELQYARIRKLVRRGAATKQQLDEARAAWKQARAAEQRAGQLYGEARQGTREEQIEVARAQVAQAQANLGLAEINLGYTTLRAPRAGMILVRQAELGDVALPGTPMVTLADLDHVWLRAYVPETELARVRWGQPAEVRTDTYPHRVFHGRVSFIASEAEFTPKTVQTREERVALVYRIKIDLPNPDHALKPGMPAEATVELVAPPQKGNAQIGRARTTPSLRDPPAEPVVYP